MTLEHYSREIIEFVENVPQEEVPSFKPRGLWVSVKGEHDWPEWCEAESFGIGPVRHEVVLSPDANILTLSTVSELDVFHIEYGAEAFPGRPSLQRRYPDWRRLANEFDGIIIAPYQWERRLDGAVSDWYYPWDCASGCIWNSSAIAHINAVGEANCAT